MDTFHKYTGIVQELIMKGTDIKKSVCNDFAQTLFSKSYLRNTNQTELSDFFASLFQDNTTLRVYNSEFITLLVL